MIIHILTCSHTGSCNSYMLIHISTHIKYSHMLICSQTCTHSWSHTQMHKHAFTDMITHSNAEATIYIRFLHSRVCNAHAHTGSHTHMHRHRHSTLGPTSPAKLRSHLVCSQSLHPRSCSRWHYLRLGITSPCGLRQDVPCFLWLAHHSSDDPEYWPLRAVYLS